MPHMIPCMYACKHTHRHEIICFIVVMRFKSHGIWLTETKAPSISIQRSSVVNAAYFPFLNFSFPPAT